MVEETCFHLFNQAVVNAHILHTETSKKKMLLHIFYAKVAECRYGNSSRRSD